MCSSYERLSYSGHFVDIPQPLEWRRRVPRLALSDPPPVGLHDNSSTLSHVIV